MSNTKYLWHNLENTCMLYICVGQNIFWYPVLLLGSQCQTSSPEKHSSHFESIMSLFKLPPQPTNPPLLLLTVLTVFLIRFTAWIKDWNRQENFFTKEMTSIPYRPNSWKYCRSLFDRHLLGGESEKADDRLLFYPLASFLLYFALLYLNPLF